MTTAPALDTIAPADIRAGDTIGATHASNGTVFVITVDRPSWRHNQHVTALSDGNRMYEATTNTLRLLHRPIPDPGTEPCAAGCGHTYPTDELTRDRGGDLVCADCINAWADHPDRRP